MLAWITVFLPTVPVAVDVVVVVVAVVVVAVVDKALLLTS